MHGCCCTVLQRSPLHAFRCIGTFCNYLGHVKLLCQLAGVSTAAFYDDRVKRAKTSILKRSPFQSREKRFIRQEVVARLMTHEYENTTEAALAMLCLVSYVFMLRLPSEALPMVWGKHAPGIICMSRKSVLYFFFAYYLHVGTNCVHQSYLWIEGPRLCLKLKTRKNRQHGTTLWRECWCGTSAMSRFTCPIHTFGHPYDCSP